MLALPNGKPCFSLFCAAQASLLFGSVLPMRYLLSMEQVLVNHKAGQQRFEAEMEAATAFLSYTFEDGHVVFDHTYVPDRLRGKGVAGALATAALNHARENGWSIVPRCLYVAAFVERHPEFGDLVHRQ
jgi:uncharacterized protein